MKNRLFGSLMILQGFWETSGLLRVISLSLVRCSPSGPLPSSSPLLVIFFSVPPPLGMRGGIYSVNIPPLKASNEDSESIIFP